MNSFSNDQHEHGSAGESDALLDQILQNVRDEPVPEFPDPLLPIPSIPEPPLPKLRADCAVTGDAVRYGYQALAAAAAVVFFTTFLLWAQTSQSAFARMQAALQEVRSISYSVMDYHSDGNSWETKVKIVEPDLSRSEQIKVGEGQVANGLQISDWSQNLRLHIDNVNHKATFFEVNPDEEFAARRNLFIEKLRRVQEHATLDLGPTTFNGRPARAFMMMMGDREFKVFVDDATSLPVQMDYDRPVDGFREVFQDFVFDGEIDRNLFSLEAPEGYVVKHIALKKPPADAGLIVVSPTTGIGPVPFGSDVHSVIDFLGEPSSRQNSAGYISLHYNSLGLEIGLGATFAEPGGEPVSDCVLRSIRCLGQKRAGPSVHGFAGQTPEGIRIGSSLEELKAAYGQAEITDGQSVNYLRLGVDFHIVEGKVGGLTITESVPDNIEIIVDDNGGYSQRIRQAED